MLGMMTLLSRFNGQDQCKRCPHCDCDVLTRSKYVRKCFDKSRHMLPALEQATTDSEKI